MSFLVLSDDSQQNTGIDMPFSLGYFLATNYGRVQLKRFVHFNQPIHKTAGLQNENSSVD